MLHPGRIDAATSQPATMRIIQVARLPDGLGELAADAIADGHRMVEVLREDWEAGTLRFDAWGQALFTARIGPALVGLCGLTRDPYLQGEVAGRVRRLYVRRAARRFGAGRALVEAVAAQALAQGYYRLRLRSPASAFAFYESCGFLRLVGEGGATHARSLA